MAATKYVLAQIKIEGAFKDVIAKSDGENVTVSYNGTEQTLASALASILASVSSAGENVDAKISTAISGLINGAPETYDTLKEIADYIASDKTAMDSLLFAIGSKVDKTALDALKTTVEGLSASNHTHENKSVLDGVTADKISEWDSKAGKSVATASADGLMSSADKVRLDGLRGVRIGATAPEDMQDGELFIKIL